MQTRLAEQYSNTPLGKEADKVLRSCVHCGFCNATCPTYQLLGDELDGPRGRIYLIKQVLEGATATAQTQQHLDISQLKLKTSKSSALELRQKLLDARIDSVPARTGIRAPYMNAARCSKDSLC